MVAYCFEVHQLKGHFDGLELHHMRQSDNMATDALARMGTLHKPIPPNDFLKQL
jgi:hypothetical protein